MAQIGKRVFLVDGDLRRPSVHAYFGLPNGSGLTNLILSGNEAGIVQQIPDLPNLGVITSGPLPANPSELLNSDQVADVMAYLAELADVVIYDAPPMGLVTDPAILGARADAVIFVARAGVTRRNLIQNAKQALLNVGVALVLPVLNGVVRGTVSTYNGYYGYGRYHTLQAESANVFGKAYEGGPANPGLRADGGLAAPAAHTDENVPPLVPLPAGEAPSNGHGHLTTAAPLAPKRRAPAVAAVAAPGESMVDVAPVPVASVPDGTAAAIPGPGNPAATVAEAPALESPTLAVVAPTVEAPRSVRTRKAAPVAASAVAASKTQRQAAAPAAEVLAVEGPKPAKARPARPPGAKPAVETSKPVRKAAVAAEAGDRYVGLPVSNAQLNGDAAEVVKGSSRQT
jgi:capsular exopolysaccharide synthesis family protein